MNIEILKDEELKTKLRRFVYDIIGCCQEVHKEKGPELTEYVYQECLKYAFEDKGVKFKKEYRFHPTFRGRRLKATLRADFFCKDKVFLECKAIDRISTFERIQLTNYMRNAGVRIGILYDYLPLSMNAKNSILTPTPTLSITSKCSPQKK